MGVGEIGIEFFVRFNEHYKIFISTTFSFSGI